MECKKISKNKIGYINLIPINKVKKIKIFSICREIVS